MGYSMVRLSEMLEKLSPYLNKRLTEMRIGNLLRKNPSGLRFKELVEGSNRTKKTVSNCVKKDWLQRGYIKHVRGLYILTRNGEEHLRVLETIPLVQQSNFEDMHACILFEGTESMATTVFIGYTRFEADRAYEKLADTLSGHNVHGSIIFQKPKGEKERD